MAALADLALHYLASSETVDVLERRLPAFETCDHGLILASQLRAIGELREAWQESQQVQRAAQVLVEQVRSRSFRSDLAF
jgi:hypothetical protein